MKVDTFRLIIEVEKRRELWDSTMNMSLRKDAGIVLWQEVASVMQVDVNVVKKRFKGLRDSYRAEVRKIQKGSISHSNWPYFRALEFMRIIFDPDRLVPFSPIPFNMEFDQPVCEQSHFDDFVIDVDNDDSFDFDIVGDIFKRDSTDTPAHDSGSNMSAVNTPSAVSYNRSEHAETPPTLFLSSVPPMDTPAKRARLCPAPLAESSYVNGCTAPAKSSFILTDMAKDDADYNFLVSLLPHLKTLSSMNNMKFRTDVSRMLMDLNQQEQESERLPQNNNFHNVTQSPTTFQNKRIEPDPKKYNVPNTPKGSPYVTHSSVIECDVKIENEFI